MDGDRRVCHQVAHPPRLRRTTEAKSAVEPHAVDVPRIRPRVRPDRRDPVIRRDPDTGLDVAPWKKTVRSARRAISGGEANSTNRRGLPGHESSLQAVAMRLSPPPVTRNLSFDELRKKREAAARSGTALRAGLELPYESALRWPVTVRLGHE